jgi:hypothetical protein
MDYHVDFSTVTTDNDRVAVITTKPLTDDEKWVEMKRGELLMFDKGLPYFHASACERAEKEGRGLCSKVNKRINNRNGRFKRERFQSMDSIMVPDEVCTLANTIAGESNSQEAERFQDTMIRGHC